MKSISEKDLLLISGGNFCSADLCLDDKCTKTIHLDFAYNGMIEADCTGAECSGSSLINCAFVTSDPAGCTADKSSGHAIQGSLVGLLGACATVVFF